MIRAFVATRGASRLLFAAILLFPLLAAQADPVVANVRASQRTDGSGLVDVYYNLSGGAGKMFANLYFSSDNGVNWNIVPASSLLSGDVGPNILNGTDRHIVWNVAWNGPEFSGPKLKPRCPSPKPDKPQAFCFPVKCRWK